MGEVLKMLLLDPRSNTGTADVKEVAGAGDKFQPCFQAGSRCNNNANPAPSDVTSFGFTAIPLPAHDISALPI